MSLSKKLCIAKTRTNNPCKRYAYADSKYCYAHKNLDKEPGMPEEKKGITELSGELADATIEPEEFETDGEKTVLSKKLVNRIRWAYYQLKHMHFSIFLDGSGGVGKTFFIKAFCAYANQILNDSKIAITASSGKASVAIKGQTIHSWSKIGYADTLDYYALLSKIDNTHWDSVWLLIIDEIYMLSANAFRTIDFLARERLERDKPFGGLSLLLSGDFCQLKPIKDMFIFDT